MVELNRGRRRGRVDILIKEPLADPPCFQCFSFLDLPDNRRRILGNCRNHQPVHNQHFLDRPSSILLIANSRQLHLFFQVPRRASKKGSVTLRKIWNQACIKRHLIADFQ